MVVTTVLPQYLKVCLYLNTATVFCENIGLVCTCFLFSRFHAFSRAMAESDLALCRLILRASVDSQPTMSFDACQRENTLIVWFQHLYRSLDGRTCWWHARTLTRNASQRNAYIRQRTRRIHRLFFTRATTVHQHPIHRSINRTTTHTTHPRPYVCMYVPMHNTLVLQAVMQHFFAQRLHH
jgi:hypothetical protein